MNTPSHLMLSLAVLTRRGEGNEPTYVAPAIIGALLPDAPMFVFYAIEKFVLGSSEQEIWNSRYFLTEWQDFFDLFNSVPIVAVALFVAWKTKHTGWYICFLSMLLHIACDLPLHHDDGHRHCWPLSDWRFASPVSYWDANHYGRPAAIAESLLFVGCYIWSMKKHDQFKIRAGATALAMIHLGFMTFALLYWAGL
jgi:hypothetical protein